jgi:hypothetical protein
MDNINNNLVLCKKTSNIYYYYNNFIWEKIIGVKNIYNLITKIKKNNIDNKNRKIHDIYSEVKANFSDIKNKIKIINIDNESKKNNRYIGFNNGIYDLEENKLIINNNSLLISSLCNYNYSNNKNSELDNKLYNSNNKTDYENLMMLIYEVLYNKNNNYYYVLLCDKIENNIISSLIDIFSNYITFIDLDKRNYKKKKHRRIIYYKINNNSKINKYKVNIIDINNINKIDETIYEYVFNQVITYYRNLYINKIDNNKNILYDKRGRPMKYNTEEEKKQAKKENYKKYTNKEDYKAKKREYNARYYKKNNIKVRLKNKNKNIE